MRRPVNAPYTITTEFGVADSYAKFGYHSGVDYGVALNTPIYAPIGGTLRNVVSPTGGNMVVIHDGTYWHRLMHNNSFVGSDRAVTEGEIVAYAGTTGLSTGVHSHWDINREGTYPTSFSSFIDPAVWLESKPKEEEVNMHPSKERIISVFRMYLGREATQTDIDYYLLKTNDQLVDTLADLRFKADAKKIADLNAQLGTQYEPVKETLYRKK